MGLTVISIPQLRSRSGSIRGSRTSDEGTNGVEGQYTIGLGQDFSRGLLPSSVARKRRNLSFVNRSLAETVPVPRVVK